MNIEKYLSNIIEKSFEKLGYNTMFAKVVTSTREGVGHFQCNGAMPLAKFAKKAPFLIAQDIIDNIDPEDKKIFSTIELAKPGFINLSLNKEFLANTINKFVSCKKFGYKNNNQKSVVIDFGGPNVAKPMHVGHIRSTLIGDSLQRLHKFCGDKVISDAHLGDWGLQMGMLIDEIKLMNPNLPYFNESFEDEYPKESPVTVKELAEIYPRASKRCKSNKEDMDRARKATFELQEGRKGYRALWKHFVDVSVKEVKSDFSKLGVHFDLWLGESDSNKYISEMMKYLEENNYLQKDDGAYVIDIEQDGIPPLIVIKSDGAVMYGTTDMATLWQRQKDFAVDKVIYVVDKRQSLHFKQVFTAVKKSKIVNENCELKHVAFGTVNGKDGRPFKTREGGVMHLSSLIDEAKSRAKARMQDINPNEKLIEQVALSSIKFGDLVNIYSSDYVFDLEKFSKYEGKTGPYLLYTSVRIKSIIRKALDFKFDVNIDSSTNEYEEKIQLQLLQFPIVIEKAYEKSEPHHICEYAYNLASAFSRFYVNCPILSEENEKLKASKLSLCIATLKALTLSLEILGLEIPEKM